VTNPSTSNILTSCAIVATANTSGADDRVTATATGAHTITINGWTGASQAVDTAFSLIVSC
jgi:hypothetical protein